MIRHNATLVVMSVVSILWLTLHITDDIVRGISKAEPSKSALLVLVVFVYGTLGGLGGFTFILSARGLWSLRRASQGQIGNGAGTIPDGG